MTSSRAVTVLLADDEAATRAGLRSLLEPQGLLVVAEAGIADKAIDLAAATRPDLCLLDIRLRGGGIEAISQIHRRVPKTKIVVLTDSAREEDFFAALRAGADGYLLKSMPPTGVLQALRGALRGEAALSRELTGLLVLELRNRAGDRRIELSGTETVELSRRESETLRQLRQGKSTGEIAAYLGISQVTVRRHISTTQRKLGVADRRGLIELLERADRDAAAS